MISMPDDFQILSRKDWGASRPCGEAVKHSPRRIVLHHTFRPTAADYFKLDEGEKKQLVWNIQKYHQRTQLWNDIAYHYLIGPDGLVFEGRPADTVGSHCGGNPPANAHRVFGNTGSIGICLIGDYDVEEPDARMLCSLNRLLGNVLVRFPGIEKTSVYGHFQAWSRPPKTCPGRKLVRIVGSVYPGMSAAWEAVYPQSDRNK